MTAYYNEVDPYAAQWLRNLIAAGHIAPGEVDERARAAGTHWLDGVCADLEGIDYACRAAVVPASSVGAPHRRDRLWFIADPEREQLREQSGRGCGANRSGPPLTEFDGEFRAMADAGSAGLSLSERQELCGARRREEGRAATERSGWPPEPGVGRVAHGVPARVGRLRAYGNAIVPQVAAEVIAAFMDVLP